ncbi:hypothetical protein [Aquimarina mytili]|uniref:Uncharacterized protein n=1 Tax=Aquimarina mytili TaxID=874423 RepID=A0A936ZX82_9FLAO|nr:hypothetical protein [Aquimarina mytili]MBL0682741.1 hypothetical protein [Aquimarina mytili]
MTISVRLLPFLFFLSHIYVGSAQTEEDTLKDIRKKYTLVQQWLEKDSRLPNIEIYEQCPDDEGHEDVSMSKIQYYYHQKKLRYVVHHFEPYVNADIQTEYYFWDDKLFFCFQSGEDRYLHTLGDTKKNIQVYEKRVYLSKGTPFLCLTKEYKELETEEGNWPSKNPFDQLDRLPNKKIACNRLSESINDADYYLDLLKLSNTELEENCMTRQYLD